MVFTGYFAVAVLVVLGVADLVVKKWQRAGGELVAAAAGFAAGIVLLRSGGAMYASAAAASADQSGLMREVVGTMMNWSIVGFAVGGIAGTLLAMRRRRLEES